MYQCIRINDVNRKKPFVWRLVRLKANAVVCPGFDPSILRRSGIGGAANEAVLNIVHKKEKNPKNAPLKIVLQLEECGGRWLSQSPFSLSSRWPPKVRYQSQKMATKSKISVSKNGLQIEILISRQPQN